MPPGYTITVAGAVEESGKGQGSIAVGVPMMLFLIFTLLMLQLQSFSRSMLVFLTGPMGIAGVAGALLLLDRPFGFVGEFMVILASFQSNPWIALVAAFTLIIGAAYTLWLVKRVIFGEVTNPKVAKFEDLNAREWIVLGSFAAAVLALGIYPKPLTDLMDSSVLQIVNALMLSKA